MKIFFQFIKENGLDIIFTILMIFFVMLLVRFFMFFNSPGKPDQWTADSVSDILLD